jgi:hypothetical protein
MIRQQETPESESNSTAQQALENANKVDDGREALSKVNNTVQEASDSGVLRFVGNLLSNVSVPMITPLLTGTFSHPIVDKTRILFVRYPAQPTVV